MRTFSNFVKLVFSTLWSWSKEGKLSASVGSWHSTYHPRVVLSGVKHNIASYLDIFFSFFTISVWEFAYEPLQDSWGCLHGSLPHSVRLWQGQDRLCKICMSVSALCSVNIVSLSATCTLQINGSQKMQKLGTWFSTQVDLSFWRRLNECLESYAWRFEDMYVWCLLKKGTLRNNITLMSSHLENCLFIFVQLIVCKNNIWIDLELMSMWQCNLLLLG